MRGIERTAAALEAFLFIKGNPVTMKEMEEALHENEAVVREALHILAEKYSKPDSGITLHESGAGWALATKKEYDAWLTETTGEQDRLSSGCSGGQRTGYPVRDRKNPWRVRRKSAGSAHEQGAYRRTWTDEYTWTAHIIWNHQIVFKMYRTFRY